MTSFKTIFPFRVGCTSYVIPDDILPNVRMMADTVDDIELILFEGRDCSNLPSKEVLDTLGIIAEDNNLTYSVHHPIDTKAAADDRHERETFLNSVLKITELTGNLPVSSHVLHLEGLRLPGSGEEHRRWMSCVNELCDALQKSAGIPMSRFSIENLSYDPVLHDVVIGNYGFSYCIDVGHLWLQGYDWRTYVPEKIGSAAVVHLHGVDRQQQDHVSLKAHAAPHEINDLLHYLKNYTGVVTLEVFSERDTFESLEILKDVWQESFS